MSEASRIVGHLAPTADVHEALTRRLPIVVVSGAESPVGGRRVLKAGASGCMRKSTQPAVSSQLMQRSCTR